LREAPRDVREALVLKIAGAILSSPFRLERRWREAVVVIEDGKVRVTARPDWAAYLNANGLSEPADACMRRQIPRGSILVWVSGENELGACAQFIVVALRAEIDRFAAAEKRAA
jgi:hypothetical protein